MSALFLLSLKKLMIYINVRQGLLSKRLLHWICDFYPIKKLFRFSNGYTVNIL